MTDKERIEKLETELKAARDTLNDVAIKLYGFGFGAELEETLIGALDIINIYDKTTKKEIEDAE